MLTYCQLPFVSPMQKKALLGSIADRSGAFVFQHMGNFENGIAKVALSIVPGSGTEGLHQLQGEGEFAVGHQPPFKMTLDYDFK